MRILLLNYEFPPLGGGAGNATYYLLKEFANDPNIKIDLVTSSVNYFRIERFSDNINIHFLDIGKKKNLHYQSNKDLLSYSWKAYWYSKKLMSQTKYDLCHAFFGIPCGYVAMKLGLPYIVSLRGSDVPFYNKRFHWIDNLILKRLSIKIWKHAIKVVANSQKLKELALSSNLKQQIEVIFNGIDTEKFRPLENKEVIKPIKLISTGRLIKRKGYEYLIEAIANMKEIELTLVGDGNIKTELEALAKEKKASINFLGKKDHEEIASLLQKADVFVLPSLNEGMSNSLLEAIAVGLPAIVTDTGGSIELVKDNGLIISKASPGELRKAILSYVNDKNLINLHSLASRMLAEKMSWKNTSDDYKKIYDKFT